MDNIPTSMNPPFPESPGAEASTAHLAQPPLPGQSQATLPFADETEVFSASARAQKGVPEEADPAGRPAFGVTAQDSGISDLDVDTLVLHGTRNEYLVCGKSCTWTPDSPWTALIDLDEEPPYPSTGPGSSLPAELVGLLLPGLDCAA